MGPYILKRVLWAIPALWGLATAVFLLSRLLPGTFGTERILQREGAYFSKGSETDRKAAYREYVARTGQDLPLFYLSVNPKSQASAITPHLTSSDNAQEQLEKLSWRYGSPAHAQAYIARVEALEKSFETSADELFRAKLALLRTNDHIAPLQQTVKEIIAIAPQPQVRAAAAKVLTALQNLKQQQQPLAFLLPQWTWHGTNNQYHQWLLRALQGNLGESYSSSRSVTAILLEAIGNTWWLLLCSMLVTLVIALEGSVMMAQKRGNLLRKFLLPLLFLLDSIPPFVLALLLLVLLANPDFLQLFPVYGMGYYMPQKLSLWQELMQWSYYMALPALCLVLFNLPYLTSQVYNAITAAMQADYTRTARAKGLSEAAIVRSHVLRNSLLPIITILSDFLPALVTGTFIVETIFAIPGIGRLLIESVLSRDYPVLTGIVLVVAIFRIASYIVADVAYAWADPRIKQKMR